jgi:hypothetical protein
MFPDARVFLPIGINAKVPTPTCGALESLLETSVFSNPFFGIPFEMPVAGQTELTSARGAIASIATRGGSRSRQFSAGRSCAVRDRG